MSKDEGCQSDADFGALSPSQDSDDSYTVPPLEDDPTAMMLGLVPDKRTPTERLFHAIRTGGESLKYHYDDPA